VAAGPVAVDPPGQDRLAPLKDQLGVGGLDRPGPAGGAGDVPAVDDQLAEQDAEGGVGPDPLAAVEAERRRLLAVGPHLGDQGDQVAADPGRELAQVGGAEGPELLLIDGGQAAWVLGPGAPALGAVGVAGDDGGDVGGGVPDRPGRPGDRGGGIGEGVEQGGEAAGDPVEGGQDPLGVGAGGPHATPPPRMTTPTRSSGS